MFTPFGGPVPLVEGVRSRQWCEAALVELDSDFFEVHALGFGCAGDCDEDLIDGEIIAFAFGFHIHAHSVVPGSGREFQV